VLEGADGQAGQAGPVAAGEAAGPDQTALGRLAYVTGQVVMLLLLAASVMLTFAFLAWSIKLAVKVVWS